MANMILLTGLDYGDIYLPFTSRERKLSRRHVKLYVDASTIRYVEMSGDSIAFKTNDMRHCLYFNDKDEQEAVFNKLINYCK
jgi:hypothetical protein